MESSVRQFTDKGRGSTYTTDYLGKTADYGLLQH
jgi:hypothetical protein